jgi:hypothetical protein
MNDMRQMTALGRSIEEGSFTHHRSRTGPHDFPHACSSRSCMPSSRLLLRLFLDGNGGLGRTPRLDLL